MRRLGVRLLLLAVCLLAVGGCAARPMVSVEELDVVVRVQPNGSVEVQEQLELRFAGDTPVDRFERDIRLERADEVIFLSASTDGRPIERDGTGDVRVDVVERPHLSVTWIFPPASSGSRTVGLRYLARGAVAISGSRGSLRQAVIPSGRPYAIAVGRVVLEVPADAHVFDGTGIAEPGWDVSRLPRGISAERHGIAPADGATVVAEISVDRARVAEPTWQHHQDWARQLVPAFISGGLFILVIGAGILWIVRFQYPRRQSKRAAAGRPGPIDDDDQERQSVRAGLRTGGLVAIGLGGVLAGVTWLTLGHLGLWPMALPVSIFLVGVVFVALARTYV